MKTGNKTTSILLERGIEDVQLLKEINKIIAASQIRGTREFAEKYPLILGLRQVLSNEIEDFITLL